MIASKSMITSAFKKVDVSEKPPFLIADKDEVSVYWQAEHLHAFTGVVSTDVWGDMPEALRKFVLTGKLESVVRYWSLTVPAVRLNFGTKTVVRYPSGNWRVVCLYTHAHRFDFNGATTYGEVLHNDDKALTVFFPYTLGSDVNGNSYKQNPLTKQRLLVQARVDLKHTYLHEPKRRVLPLLRNGVFGKGATNHVVVHSTYKQAGSVCLGRHGSETMSPGKLVQFQIKDNNQGRLVLRPLVAFQIS